MSFNPLKVIKKGVKSAFRAGKKLVKGVGKKFVSAFKEVKRFVQSDLGKMVIAVALVYFGGAAIAAQSAGGAAGAAGAAGGATTVGTATAVAPITTGAAGAGAGAAGAGAAASPLAAPAAAGGVSAAPAAAGGQSLAAVGGSNLVAPQLLTPAQIAAADAAAAAPGLLSRVGAGVVENPGLSLIGGGQVLSALTAPDPGADAIALAEWRRKNSNIAGVGYNDTSRPRAPSRRTSKAELESSTRRY